VEVLAIEVGVAEIECDRLGGAKPTRVDELDEGCVSERERLVSADTVDRRLDVAGRGRIGKAPRAPRCEGCVGNAVWAERVARQRPNGGNPQLTEMGESRSLVSVTQSAFSQKTAYRRLASSSG